MTSPQGELLEPRNALSKREFPLIPAPTGLFLILAAYYTVHLVLRTVVSETAGIDDADQLMLAQQWSFGYGPQPPLYTWLLKSFLAVFGHSMFTLTLLRELLLFGISCLTYLCAKTISQDHVCGVVAVIALQFHPTISWESQRELNHSILASLIVLGMLWMLLSLNPRRLSGYLILGALGALGLLSKYNAGLVYLALLLAALSLKSVRGKILNWRMAVAVGFSLVLLLPHLAWINTHRELAFASAYKFRIDAAVPWGEAVITGLKDWCRTASAHTIVVVGVFALVFWRAVLLERKLRIENDAGRLVWRFLGLVC